MHSPLWIALLQDRQLNPQVGDKVSFRIATNLAQAKTAEKLDSPAARYGGRRATGVALVKYIGKVASLFQNGSYGFIDYEHERGMSRIFFHCSEVGKCELPMWVDIGLFAIMDLSQCNSQVCKFHLCCRAVFMQKPPMQQWPCIPKYMNWTFVV